MTTIWRKLASSSTKSCGSLKKYRMTTSYVISATMTRTASPASVDADRAMRRITRPGRLSTEGFEGEIQSALAVGPRAPEPGLPRALGECACFLDLLLRRIDDRHPELWQPLADAGVEADGIDPLLVLEIGFLHGVEHGLLQILGQRVPGLLVGHQPFL